MRKRKRASNIYAIPVLLMVVFILFGVQFALSQFPTTQPSSGAWHPSSEIQCNGCIQNSNIMPAAQIEADKMYGPNGWVAVFTPPSTPSAYYIPGSETWGIESWSGKTVKATCGQNTNEIMTVFAGITNWDSPNDKYTRIFNTYIVALRDQSQSSGLGINPTFGGGWQTIYDLEERSINNPSGTPTRNIKVYARVNSQNTNKLEVIKECSPSSALGCFADWKCLIAYVS